MSREKTPAEISDYLMSSSAIRERCEQVFSKVERGQGRLFRLDLSSLEDLSDYVISHMKESYPKLEIPYHSRWRHIETGGKDRGRLFCEGAKDEMEVGRRRYDLVIVSILLDAGAGPSWSYKEDGVFYSRSEGLAVASAAMSQKGLFSGDEKMPFKTLASGLESLTQEDLEKGMQVSSQNPLVGVSGRYGLLQKLGGVLRENKAVFGQEGRLGCFFDHLVKKADAGSKLEAKTVLKEVLRVFHGIWPGREIFHGQNLGDTWKYPGIIGMAKEDHYVPFHKLSQWLSYSLFEPLEEYGIEVLDLDGLTGLPEYRNGGLFIDGGVLEPLSPELLAREYKASDPEIVEWRALTVCLLDRLAKIVRGKLEVAADWPLAKILEGGTWAAGRKIAREKRGDGSPPLNIVSDGTVF